jgi:hypothetical protein
MSVHVQLTADPILGVRVWSVNDNRLKSTSVIQTWPPYEPLSAHCLSSCAMPPGLSCTCGIYAIKPSRCIRFARVYQDDVYIKVESPDGVYVSCVGGFVAMWGRIVLGTTGVYRAQYAYPAALWSNSSNSRMWLTQLAEQYGVPILPLPQDRQMLLEQVSIVRSTWVSVPLSKEE